ncbi:MAG: cold shock domain-containing protein [Deltaproteobacteria bacterium]|jgi:CspA family cold shock protein|nr:cold shock domain-containing protein [Deltaproteobacteria bacterium]MBW2490345.1 cold shock domain-containing protein [Deltaproteobacteria bacterium]
MKTGIVKWFNVRRGYGFIEMKEEGEEVFVHYTAINMPGFKVLSEGNSVIFDLEQSDRGPKAINVIKV